MTLIIPRLSPADCADPAQLARRLNIEVFPAIIAAFNGQQAALTAAGIATTAAENANAAATAAQTAANTAQGVANGVTATTALANSFTSGLTITATDAGTDATITISAHTRAYGDGTTAAISGGSLTGLAYSTSYWVHYDAPIGTTGAVTYVAATSVQGNGTAPNRHFVGAVTTPAALGSPIGGFPVLPPGGIIP
jgi:hypothetical protein